MLAGALRDNCVAAVQGTRSFGKGLIQGVYGLKDGGGVVVTVAEYVTPAGGVIQGQGIMGQVEGWNEVEGVIKQCKNDKNPRL